MSQREAARLTEEALKLIDMLRAQQAMDNERPTMSADRYWRIENDHTPPTRDERRALATVFNVSESVIFPPVEAAAVA